MIFYLNFFVPMLNSIKLQIYHKFKFNIRSKFLIRQKFFTVFLYFLVIFKYFYIFKVQNNKYGPEWIVQQFNRLSASIEENN